LPACSFLSARILLFDHDLNLNTVWVAEIAERVNRTDVKVMADAAPVGATA